MKLSSILLYASPFLLAFASELPSDITARSVGTTTYTVRPIDRANTYETEAILKSRYGEENVVTNRYNGIFMSWTITSPDSQLAGAIEALEGIQNVDSKHENHHQNHHPLRARDAGSSHPVVEDEQTPAIRARERLMRRDNIWYSCLANGTEIEKTEEYLKSKVQQGSEVLRLTIRGKIIGWYRLFLDDNAKREVEAYEGIRFLKDNVQKVEEFRAVTKEDRLHPLPKSHESPQISRDRNRRSGTWEKQQNADKALVMDSQYSGGDLDRMKDFVHKSDGEGIFVYVVDRGVRTNYINPENAFEFHPPDNKPSNIEIYQTTNSIYDGQKKDEDDSKDHIHGTGVAAKALGSLYGVAKKATLIVIKNTDAVIDFVPAMEQILEDITTKGRAQKSVVIYTGGWTVSWIDDYEDLKDDIYHQRSYGDIVRQLLAEGVPVVCASGNDGALKGRENIDTLPALFQDDGTPLINVGAADYAGQRWFASQGGSQLTIYAPGVDITIPQNVDRQSRTDSGTSLAAAQVGGLIATYLSYAQKPWDDSKTGIERVKAIRDYLVSQASSWERQPGIRMIWNGATKQDHDSVGANAKPHNAAPKDPTPPSPPAPEKSQALGIVASTRSNKYTMPNERIMRENKWLFFSAKRGASSTCYKEIDAVLKTKLKEDRKALVDNPGWLAGTYSFKIDNMDCDYKNDGKGNPGALWCKGRDGPIECFEEHKHTAQDGTLECEKGGDEVLRRPVAYCEW